MAVRSNSLLLALLVGCGVFAGCNSNESVDPALPKVEPETRSLLGSWLYAPEKTGKEKDEAEWRLAAAKTALDVAPDDKDKVIWYGRMLAAANHFKDSEQFFESAVKRFPEDSRMYRHLGHRQITLRRFDDAIATLRKGAELAKNEPDSPEPSSKPGGATLDTAHQNIYYHLGVACFMKGDYPSAESAFAECHRLAANPDSLCSATHWLFMALERQGKHDAAKALLEKITPDLVVLENHAYHDLCRLYRGELDGEKHFAELDPKSVDYPTFGFGYANLELTSGHREHGLELCRTIVSNSTEVWMAFGCMGCEAELARVGK